MIDIKNEALISLAEAAKHVPSYRPGRATHVSALQRWIMRGVRRPDGGRVRMEGVRIGARWATSIEALQRFIDKLTPNTDVDADVPIRSATKREKAIEHAQAELAKLGI